jgi:hypothetical protein
LLERISVGIVDAFTALSPGRLLRVEAMFVPGGDEGLVHDHHVTSTKPGAVMPGIAGRREWMGALESCASGLAFRLREAGTPWSSGRLSVSYAPARAEVRLEDGPTIILEGAVHDLLVLKDPVLDALAAAAVRIKEEREALDRRVEGYDRVEFRSWSEICLKARGKPDLPIPIAVLGRYGEDGMCWARSDERASEVDLAFFRRAKLLIPHDTAVQLAWLVAHAMNAVGVLSLPTNPDPMLVAVMG